MPSTAEGHINMILVPRMRAMIADDEPLSREKLRFLLEKESDVQIVAECTGVDDTLSAIRSHRPDLLLLDIELEGGNGFDILRSVPNSELPIVIFTTAYDSYALQAFEAHALDYLLKPFDQERLRRALDRAKTLCGALAETGHDYWRAGEEDTPPVTGDQTLIGAGWATGPGPPFPGRSGRTSQVAQ